MCSITNHKQKKRNRFISLKEAFHKLRVFEPEVLDTQIADFLITTTITEFTPPHNREITAILNNRNELSYMDKQTYRCMFDFLSATSEGKVSPSLLDDPLFQVSGDEANLQLFYIIESDKVGWHRDLFELALKEAKFEHDFDEISKMERITNSQTSQIYNYSQDELIIKLKALESENDSLRKQLENSQTTSQKRHEDLEDLEFLTSTRYLEIAAKMQRQYINDNATLTIKKDSIHKELMEEHKIGKRAAQSIVQVAIPLKCKFYR